MGAYDKDFRYRRAGIQSVGPYQVSGHPFITGGVFLPGSSSTNAAPLDPSSGRSGVGGNALGVFDTIEFPLVTKTVTVINTNFFTGSQDDASLGNGIIGVYFGDTDNARPEHPDSPVNQNHYIALPNTNDSLTLDIRCTKMHIANLSQNVSASYQVIAELTLISDAEMYAITGSGTTHLTASDG
tara:strand:- start:536 stop:1087 length:552 start_codon:yes stop_codon:yes gene_type:complete